MVVELHILGGKMNPNKAILKFYNTLGDSKKVPFGHTVENFQWILEFTQDGKFYDLIDLGRDGRMQAVVENYKRSGGIQPYTLFDAPKYVCGLSDRDAPKYNAFRELVSEYSDIDPVDSFLLMLSDEKEIFKIRERINKLIEEGYTVSFMAFRLRDGDILLHDIKDVRDRRVDKLLKNFGVCDDEYPTCIHCGRNKYPIITNTAGKISGFDGAIISNFDDTVKSYGEVDNSGTHVCVDCGFNIAYTYSMLGKFNSPYRYRISSNEMLLFFNEEFPELEKGEFDLVTNINKYFGDMDFIEKDSFLSMLDSFRKNQTPIYKKSKYDIIHLIDKKGKTPIIGWNVLSTEEISDRVNYLLSCLHPRLQIRFDIFWQLAAFGYYASSQEGEKGSTSGKSLLKNLQQALIEYTLFGKEFEKYLVEGLTKNLVNEIIVNERNEINHNQFSLLNIMKGENMDEKQDWVNLGKVFRLYGMAQQYAIGKVNHGINDLLVWALKKPVNTILLYERVTPSFKKLESAGKGFIRNRIDEILSSIDVNKLSNRFSAEQRAYFLYGYAIAKEEYFNQSKVKGEDD